MTESLFLLARPSDLTPPLRSLRAKVVSSRAALVRESLHSAARAVWVAPHAEVVGWFKSCSSWRRRDQRLLVLADRGTWESALLHALFGVVLSTGSSDGSLLPRSELLAVLASPHRGDLFIGGTVDRKNGVLVLYRGDLEPLVVPLDWFEASPDGVRPDPCRFAVTDFGQTVTLGEYEAATHTILYDFDRAFRRRAKARSMERDATFGGSLRRLRILRGLTQAAFEPAVSAKEVARLERGLVKKPHGRTLKALAARLRVKQEELATY